MYYFQPDESVPQDIIEKVEEISFKFGLTWRKTYYYAQNTTEDDLSNLIVDSASFETQRRHIFTITTNPNPKIDYFTIYDIARASMAEIDCTFSSIPPIFIPPKDVFTDAAAALYVKEYIKRFERISYLWAADLMDQHYPNYLEQLILDRTSISIQNAVAEKQAQSLNEFTLFDLISEAVLTNIMAGRAVNIAYTEGIAQTMHLKNFLKQIAGEENIAWFEQTWETLYMNYIDLPQMPLGRSKAAMIIAAKAKVHAEAIGVRVHPELAPNPLADEIPEIKGHFWTIDIPPVEVEENDKLIMRYGQFYNPN